MVMKFAEKRLMPKKPLQVYVQNGEFIQYDQPKYRAENVDKIISQELITNWFIKKTFINLDELESMFKLRNKEAIQNFIQLKPFLIDVLKNCYQKIRDYFDDDKMELELLHDPMDNEERLVLYILTSKAPKDAIKTLINFNKEWWVKNSVNARSYLSIDVESQCLTGPNI